MIKLEQLKSAIAGAPCEYPPFSFWSHLPEGEKSGQAAVEVQAEFYRRTGVNFIKMMIDGYRDISQGFSVQKPSDWDRLSLPAMDSPFICEQLALIDALASATQGEVPIIYHMFSPYSVMRMIWGHDLVASHLGDRTGREYLLRALASITAFQAAAAERYLEKSPAAGLMITMSGAEQDGIGAAQFCASVRPSDLAVIGAVQKTGKLVMLHLCGWGKRPNQMELWKDYPADVVNYDTVEDNVLPLSEAGGFFTGSKAIMGGFGCGTDSVLARGNPKTIKEHVRRCVLQGGPTGYLVGAGGSFPPGVVAPETFRLVGEALKEGEAR